MGSAIAVIDIGMTNKKVVVYDEGLALLDSASRSFEPVMVEGLPTHDLEGMEAWFLERLAELGRRHSLGAIVVATHGATLVCVGPDGRACAPCVYYTHEPGEAFQERFYAFAGDPVELQRRTGTPRLSALINPAKGLLFLKERFPERFAASAAVLNYPQYWGFRLTGRMGAEGTYIGCHTYLWDWERSRPSSVAVALGVDTKMPSELRDSWDLLGRLRPEVARRTGLSPETIVTMGLHDSNASLLPHIVKRRRREFVLNSTGTWCVLMHPQEEYRFSDQELGKVVFFNRSAFNRPVKTAIFLGGMEYEKWSGLAARFAGQSGAEPSPGPETYRALLRERSVFILPELVPGSGQFPGSTPRAVQDGRTYSLDEIESGRATPPFLADRRIAMAALNLSLALQTIVALRRSGLSDGTDLFTEGGFRRNADYNGLLAAALPRNAAYLTGMEEATSFGAAMTGLAALRRESPERLADRFDIEYKAVAPMGGVEALEEYASAWMRLADEDGRA